MSLLISILGILITIFLVVGIHELGHFSVARLCGIKVLRFSIGFGKKLWGWKDKRGTEYIISLIPLGGYVQMVDETENEVPESELRYSFNRQPLYKRMAVVFAGPVANLIFAFLLYWLLFMIGFTAVKPIIGEVSPNSIAATAGLKSQEEILQIDHHPTLDWQGVIIRLIERSGDTNTLLIKTQSPPAVTHDYQLNLSTWKMDDLKPDPLASLGIQPYSPPIPPIIDTLQKDSPAEKDGLQVNDKIVAIGSESIHDWMTIVKIITNAPDQTLQFHILRQNKMITLPVTPETKRSLFGKAHGYLGMLPKAIFPENLLRHQQYGPIAAIPKAYEQFKLFLRMNIIVLEKLVLGKLSIKSLGGPITVFESAGTALNNGMIPFISFLAFLSISIGIINLFPLPGLDGGNILIQIIELVIGRPLSDRAKILLYRLGFILVLIFITQTITNDIARL